MPQPWTVRKRILDLSDHTHIMGVLNVTPDSFSDGGRYASSEAAIHHALQMHADGADIIDIGGESSRPGSTPVSMEEELARVLPVVAGVAAANPEIVMSIDTTKSEVAEAALRAGAHIVNDISGLRFDRRIVEVTRQFGAGLVIMHMQGNPRTMQDAPSYRDVTGEVAGYLKKQIDEAVRAGVTPGQLVVDPGIGFGKSLEHNLDLLRHTEDVSRICDRPVLIGVSRKRFIGAITGRDVEDRLAGSLAAMAYAITRGARIIRVHDVKESCDVARMMDKLTSDKGDYRCRYCRE